MPVQRFAVQIRRRKAERMIHLDWNPLARRLEPPACEFSRVGRTPTAGLRRRDPPRHPGGARALRQLREAVLPRLPPGAVSKVCGRAVQRCSRIGRGHR